MRLKDILDDFMVLQYIILFIYILFNYSGTVEITIKFAVGVGASIDYPIRFKFTDFALATIITAIIAIIVLNIAVSALGVGGDKTPSTIGKVVLMIIIITFLGQANLWMLQAFGTFGVVLTVLFGIADTFSIFNFAFSDTAEEI